MASKVLLGAKNLYEKIKMENVKEDSVTVQTWVKRGILRVNTEYLDWDDPDHPYNQILAQGKRPENFGYRNPKEQEFEGKSRSELIEEILNLRKEITFYNRYG